MTWTTLYKWPFGLLAIALCLNFSLSLVDEAGAAKKAKFRYNKPDVERWVDYCQKRHPDKTLQRCCSRRHGSCQSRCKKSTYPNTAYTTKIQCQQDCTATQGKCLAKATGKTTQEMTTQQLIAKATADFRQCTQRGVAKRNVCCDRKAEYCQRQVCDKIDPSRKDPSNPSRVLRRSCYDKCNQADNSCEKKYTDEEFSKIVERRWDMDWAKKECAKPKNDVIKDGLNCCSRMIKQCNASCRGYPPGKEDFKAVNGSKLRKQGIGWTCYKRCSIAKNVCRNG